MLHLPSSAFRRHTRETVRTGGGGGERGADEVSWLVSLLLLVGRRRSMPFSRCRMKLAGVLLAWVATTASIPDVL
ncbi:hypothetical protein BDA96_10G308000 [Sorghum bicolor]|uniref:Uncharacterized protein n=2 Tax=Sorghum bicolor TaxID=4558 RepID=A0A921Q804_SORBI|nr:hypothetical protein BDA96_10G308000 [Sorghum bicolor]KXG20674.1 hypothetical protein SORBI_3010G237300 [Sorghum bicolor]